MDDILRSFFGGGFSGQSQNGFNRSFNGFRSGSRGSSSRDFESGSGYDPFGSFRQETRGQSLDREAAITVGFEEAALGAKKRIQIQDETGQTRSYEIISRQVLKAVKPSGFGAEECRRAAKPATCCCGSR